MGLLVKRLSLYNWRNYTECEFDFNDGITVLVGPNAVGKTNAVEALQLLTAGYSFRKPKPRQLAKDNTERGKAYAQFIGDGRVLDATCEVIAGRRIFYTNNKKCHSYDMPHTLMSVLFSPDDLLCIKGSARLRRDELDNFGRQASAGYTKLLNTYQRTVEQRNRLLKDPDMSLSLLDAWDTSLAIGAAALLEARLKLYQRLCTVLIPIYKEISGGEDLNISYISTITEAEQLNRHELEEQLLRDIYSAREDDIRRQTTSVGPHHDDIVFTINKRSVRDFGSQGQQRSVILAWKMAEVEVAYSVVGQRPLLLLDDVMSELDGTRREATLSFINKGIQTIITTTNLGYFTDELLADAKVVKFQYE